MNGRSQYIGTHGTEEAAAWAYDEKAKQVYAEPILNFLPDGSLNPDRKHRRLATSFSSVQGDLQIVSVKDEVEGGQRPRKRGRWVQQQEEWEEETVRIKKEEEEGEVGTVVVKEEEEYGMV